MAEWLTKHTTALGETRLGRLVAAFARGQLTYLVHVLGLFWPGQDMPVVRAHQEEPEGLVGWDWDDHTVMIDEGRRQFDVQLEELDRIRSRAQWLFSVGTAVLVALASGYVGTNPDNSLMWIAGIAIMTYGIGGAAAILTVRADFSSIDTAVLSRCSPPVRPQLAAMYSRMLSVGENTVATRLTIFRQAVIFVLIGGYVGLIAYLLERSS